MARVVWKGAVSFSLIHIPVGLYPASRSASLDFDMLDRRDFAPIGYKRINKGTGETVEWGDIVKGYQYEKGEYVVMSDEDFRQANVEATQTIDIQGFVDPARIPPMYYDTPYYLAAEKPEKEVVADLRELAVINSERPYFLLVHVRESSDVARVKSICEQLGKDVEILPLDVFLKLAGENPTFQEYYYRKK